MKEALTTRIRHRVCGPPDLEGIARVCDLVLVGPDNFLLRSPVRVIRIQTTRRGSGSCVQVRAALRSLLKMLPRLSPPVNVVLGTNDWTLPRQTLVR